MFAEDGLNLADVDVSDQSQYEQEQRQEHGVLRGNSLAGEEDVTETPIQSSNVSSSLIDSYV
jgi:flagellar hook-length control protein FliK